MWEMVLPLEHDLPCLQLIVAVLISVVAGICVVKVRRIDLHSSTKILTLREWGSYHARGFCVLPTMAVVHIADLIVKQMVLLWGIIVPQAQPLYYYLGVTHRAVRTKPERNAAYCAATFAAPCTLRNPSFNHVYHTLSRNWPYPLCSHHPAAGGAL